MGYSQGTIPMPITTATNRILHGHLALVFIFHNLIIPELTHIHTKEHYCTKQQEQSQQYGLCDKFRARVVLRLQFRVLGTWVGGAGDWYLQSHRN